MPREVDRWCSSSLYPSLRCLVWHSFQFWADNSNDLIVSPQVMSHNGSGVHHLMHRWDEEDATRDVKEAQAKRAFLEQEANQLFTPLEDYLTKLGRVLHAANASVEVDPTWEHLGE